MYLHSVKSAIYLAKESKSSCTWALSNHDQIRHATKFGLHPLVNRRKWLLSNGKSNPVDFKSGTQAGLAATLFLMGLPGAIYLYQGEELGLHEVASIPEDSIQDPQYLKNNKLEKGRDGCRVPLPWVKEMANFGFSEGGSHLPQPKWFGEYAVDIQKEDINSTLSFYKKAIKLRKELLTEEELEWIEEANSQILHYSRPNGLKVITNFQGESHKLPEGIDILITSRDLEQGNKIGPYTTVWYINK